MNREILETIREITDVLPVGVWVAKAPSGELVYANSTFAEIMRMPARGAVEAGSSTKPYGVFDLEGERYDEAKLPFSLVLASKKPVTVDDLVIHHGDGKVTHVRAWGKPFFNTKGDLTQIMIAFADVSAEREAQRRLQHIQEMTPVATGVSRVRDGIVVYVNDAMCRLTNTVREEVLGKRSIDFFENPKDREALLADLATQGVARGREVWLRNSEGKRFLVSANLSRGELDGEPCVLANLTDVTDLHQIRTELQRSLEEKKVLLREIHHRVKNNLQIISSLLSLQESACQDEATRTVLANSRSRIGTVASIHNMLDQAGDKTQIKFSHFVSTLVEGLRNAWLTPNDEVEISSDIGAVELDLDRATYCGLIVNELVVNALKHAFKKGPGKVRIGMEATAVDYRLWVEDSGHGTPDTSPASEKGLGRQLIEALAEQIDGKLQSSISPLGGLRVEVLFKKASNDDGH